MFDIYDDRGEMLREYFPTADSMPDWLRRGLGHFSDREKLASDEFAVRIPTVSGMKGVYPINSDAMTAISCLYFDGNSDVLPLALQKEAAVKLWDACQTFDVECPSEKVAELASQYQEEQRPAPRLLRRPQEQGVAGSSLLPLETVEQVKTASDMFDVINSKLHPKQRREFSQRLISKTASFGLPAPSQAHKWGGPLLSRGAVLESIEKRAAYMSEDQIALLRKAADKIVEMPPEKVAEVLTAVDESTGLDVMWGKGIPDPYAIHYSETVDQNVKLAEFQIPLDQWHAACDHGVLSHLEPNVQTALRNRPELLNEYEGSPVMNYVLEGLESLGVIEN